MLDNEFKSHNCGFCWPLAVFTSEIFGHKLPINRAREAFILCEDEESLQVSAEKNWEVLGSNFFWCDVNTGGGQWIFDNIIKV